MSNRRGIKRERGEEGFSDETQSNCSLSSTSPSQKRGKFERSFVPSWLDRFEWLDFDSSRNLMFCGLCRKYRKNNAFTEGCQNFRRDNLNKHMATNDHKFCVEQNAAQSKPSPAVEHRPVPHAPSERAASPITPGGRHSSSENSRSSGIYSSASTSSLPQSPASLPLPSPPAFAPSRTPTSTLHAPVPLMPYPPIFSPYMDPRFPIFHGEMNGEGKAKDNLPITPNYLAHPPFPYMSSSSSFRPTAEQPSPTSSVPHKSPQTPALNNSSTRPTGGLALNANELVLKVRVANSVEQDFIELEIEKNRLSFEYVLSTICRELNVNPSVVHKLRKLPNTIVRKDKDVLRFVDFQELEVVLSNRGSDGYSPRHVDVVY